MINGDVDVGVKFHTRLFRLSIRFYFCAGDEIPRLFF